MVYWWCPAENFIPLHFPLLLFSLKWDFNAGLISTNSLPEKWSLSLLASQNTLSQCDWMSLGMTSFGSFSFFKKEKLPN
jgi:hypothetical protein